MENNPKTNELRHAFLVFGRVLGGDIFALENSRYPWRLVDFLKNKDKIRSQKSDPFCGHLYTGIVFFEFFTRPRKKRDTCDDLGVSVI